MFQIKRIEQQELALFQQLILLFKDVFELEASPLADEQQLKELLQDPHFVVLVAMDQDEVIGGLTAYTLAGYYAGKTELFIYDIAIQTAFQRKGVGKQLLESLNEYGQLNGISEIFVDASEEDRHAVDFYHSTGGRAEKVVQFSYPINHSSPLLQNRH